MVECEICHKETKFPKGSELTFCSACHVITWIETRCTHIKGTQFAGKSFEFIDWQEQALRQAFGTLKENGLRQYRTIYIEVGKKNGKTELASAVALYCLAPDGDGELGGEIYSAAGDRDQAALVYYPASKMVDNNEKLTEQLQVIDSRKRIVCYENNSFYQVLSSETFTKHGLNPSCVVFDELHAQKSRELYDVLTEGTDIAREQQIIFIITTAGIFDKESIGWEVHEYARKVKDGIIEDPTFLPIMYCADKDKDDWEHEETWKKVNPSLGSIFQIDNLREHYQQVKQNPARVNNFLRFRLNIWTSQISKWLPMDKWAKCNGPVDAEELKGRVCFGGLDLSSSIDLSSFAQVFPPKHEDEKWKILMKYYMPQDNVQERVKKDNVKYDVWIREGLITITPGNVIDYEFIRKDIIQASHDYQLQELAYDPWRATETAVKLENDEGITVVEHRQGFKSMSEPTKHLLEYTMAGKLAHGGHKVLAWNADNLAVKIDAAENVKPEKDKSNERIDGIVALIMALGRAIVSLGPKTSIYETEEREDGIIFI